VKRFVATSGASPSSSLVSATPRPSARTAWVDNLRTLMILLVVGIHSTVTYSHVGSWYIKMKPEPGLDTKLVFLFGEVHLQSFFMGLLFFLAGYFAEKSLQRRGAAAFLRERVVRLGIPLALYVVVIHPFIVYGLNPWNAKFPPFAQAYADYFRSGRFLSGTGPLWFLEALLIFSVGLALWPRASEPLAPPMAERPAMRLRGSFILGLAAALALTSFLVRTAQPIGTSVQNLQLCYFPQYVAAFGLGAWLARRGAGLDEIARSPTAMRAGAIALIGGPIVLAVILLLVRPSIQPGAEPSFFGGWNLFAAAYPAWEQFTGVGLALGVMALVSRVWSRQTGWSEWFSARAFGVYVLHTPVIIALAMWFKGYSANPYFNAAVLTMAGLIGSYVLADLVRRLPLMSRVL
jgi:glucan biosynthesis protein C